MGVEEVEEARLVKGVHLVDPLPGDDRQLGVELRVGSDDQLLFVELIELDLAVETVELFLQVVAGLAPTVVEDDDAAMLKIVDPITFRLLDIVEASRQRSGVVRA